MKQRRIIKRRSRFFLGCEGESEQAYGVHLNRLAEDMGLHVHIQPFNLRPAGDPLALAQKAVKIFGREARNGGFAGKAILIDADRFNEPPGRGLVAQNLLTDEGFTTIWQRPDHEGLLLRHFAGYETHDPPRGASLSALRAVWPIYRKNMAAADLKVKLTLDNVRQATSAIPELRTFLTMIGLI